MEHIYQSIPGIAVGSAAGVTLLDGRELSLVLYFISISTLNYSSTLGLALRQDTRSAGQADLME